MVTNGDDWSGATGSTPPTGWTDYGDGEFTIVDDSGNGAPDSACLKIEVNATPTANPQIVRSFTTVIGKRYRGSAWIKHGDSTSGARVRFGTSNGEAEYGGYNTTTTSWALYDTLEFTATTTTCWVQCRALGASAGEYDYFDKLSLTQIGAVAEYDGSTAGALKWGDKSGNELHGTVTGATLENTPYDSGTEYEEGTWDGVLSDGTRDMAMNGSYDTGYYTKVGNLVTVSGIFVTSSLDGGSGNATGNIRITGLPFTIANNNAAYSGGGAGGYSTGHDLAAAGQSISYNGKINSTYIALHVWDATGGTSEMQASEWDAAGQIIIGFSYRAA
jgi:hypothetical protein